jgi:hypothetical protein
MHSLGVLQGMPSGYCIEDECNHFHVDTSIAPSIVAARRTLERRFTLGVLDRKVGDRPSPQDLREHNVLLGDANGGDALLTTSHANSETNHEFVDAAGKLPHTGADTRLDVIYRCCVVHG